MTNIVGGKSWFRKMLLRTTAIALLTVAAADGHAMAAQPFGMPASISEIAKQQFGNDAAWYQNNIPFFESSDTQLDEVYYYRWSIVRAHQRDLGAQGFITTEFLNDVGWQRWPWASLNDATGFHIGEDRWLRDRRYASDYINYMYNGGNDRHFSEAIADAAYQRYLVDGDKNEILQNLPAMISVYNQWSDHFDQSKGLYWIEPIADATEYTISSIDASGGQDGFFGGQAFRPSINAYMFANARAISRLAALAGQNDVAKDFAGRAAALKANIQAALWSPDFDHFIDRYQVTNQYVSYWNPIRGRELVGYLPWTFEVVDDAANYGGAWQHALSPNELGGAHGLRTDEPSYQYYMRQYRYDAATGRPECQWNGPAWPFQTTQVLLGMANLLNDYKQHSVTPADYIGLLRQYTALHYTNGKLDLQEDYNPDTGNIIVGLDRSHHYFHSGYVDLILSGLVGIRPQADDPLSADKLVVNPLIPAVGDPRSLTWFRVRNVPFHGHLVDVTWDANGTYFPKGLTVSADGQRLAHKATLQKVQAVLPRITPPAINRPIDQAVQIDPNTQNQSNGYPHASAATNADAASLHAAIDGRVWFYPEAVNGWSSDPGIINQWFAIDFGKTVQVQRAEIAFFSDGRQFDVPASYRLQAWTPTGWQNIQAQADKPLANGITRVSWPMVNTTQIRLVLKQKPGFSTRLVELKVF